MSWRLAWASCELNADSTPGWTRIKEHAPKVFISQGDTPYCNGPFTASTTQADALAFYQTYWNKRRLAELMALRSSGMLAYWQRDDHEWTGDNWDHTITRANQGNASFTTQAQVNTHWQRCADAQEQLLAERFDHPAWDRAGNTERPSQALTEGQNPPTTNYPITYFVRDFDASGNLGGTHCRVIFLDGISYKSSTTDADGAAKHWLGLQQEAWLQSVLAGASGFAHVIIASTKKLWRSNGTDNSDTAGEYPTARNRVLGIIDASGVKPIWISGDKHVLHVCESRKAAGGFADIIDICACPIGAGLTNDLGLDFPQEIWRDTLRNGYGLLTFGQRLRAEIRHAVSGSVLWAAEFEAGSNTPIYAEPSAVRLG